VITNPSSSTALSWAVSMQRGLKVNFTWPKGGDVDGCLNAKRIERQEQLLLYHHTCMSQCKEDWKGIPCPRRRACDNLVSMQRGLKALCVFVTSWAVFMSSQCKEDWKPPSQTARKRCPSSVSMQRGLKDQI